MASPALAQKKDARIDLRLTKPQKEELELAASLSGISMSQWIIENLLSCARETIASSTRTVLDPEAFDAFAKALDQPMNPRLAAFAAEKTTWEA